MSAAATSSPVYAACPECGKASPLAELVARIVVAGMLQCPKCEIGSPAGEWRVP